MIVAEIYAQNWEKKILQYKPNLAAELYLWKQSHTTY